MGRSVERKQCISGKDKRKRYRPYGPITEVNYRQWLLLVIVSKDWYLVTVPKPNPYISEVGQCQGNLFCITQPFYWVVWPLLFDGFKCMDLYTTMMWWILFSRNFMYMHMLTMQLKKIFIWTSGRLPGQWWVTIVAASGSLGLMSGLGLGVKLTRTLYSVQYQAQWDWANESSLYGDSMISKGILITHLTQTLEQPFEIIKSPK